MFNLEQSIAEWRQQMLAAGIESSGSLEELEIHLREEIEKQMKLGASGEQAFEIATQQIGRAQALKEEFRKTKSVKETVLQAVKNSPDLVFLVLMTIVVALTYRFALEWQPVAITISHDGSPSGMLRIYNQFAGRPWGEETWMMQSICIVELLLLSLVLPFAAAFHIRRNLQNLKRLKRTTRIGQWCMAFWGLMIIFSRDPFWGLVMALMSCVLFVIVLRWQARSAEFQNAGFSNWWDDSKTIRINRVFALLWLTYCSWGFFSLVRPFLSAAAGMIQGTVVSQKFWLLFGGNQGIRLGVDFLLLLLFEAIFLRGMIAAILLFDGKIKQIRTIRFIATLGLLAFVAQIISFKNFIYAGLWYSGAVFAARTIAFRDFFPLAIASVAFNLASLWLLRSPSVRNTRTGTMRGSAC